VNRSRFAAASRDGLAEALRVELARSQPQFLDRIDRSVPAMFSKAYRWIAEMEQIACADLVAFMFGESRE
jgi:hypothetical protein